MLVWIKEVAFYQVYLVYNAPGLHYGFVLGYCVLFGSEGNICSYIDLAKL